MVINASSVMDYDDLTANLASICPSQEEDAKPKPREDAPNPQPEDNPVIESSEQEGDTHE